jgi:hypothetical protein
LRETELCLDNPLAADKDEGITAIMQSFTRFQRAIEHKQVRLALQIALEMQQMTTEWFKEAASWIGIHEDV